MTREQRVFEALKAQLLTRTDITIIALHPPSGKAYDTGLIRFPVVANDIKTRGRNHVDAIFIASDTIYLIELKGSSRESVADIVKLRALRDVLGLAKILTIIRCRQPEHVSALHRVVKLVIGLGVECHDVLTPNEFIVFQFGSELTGYAGTAIDGATVEFLHSFCDCVIS